MSGETTRTLSVGYLARVEGEGALTLRYRGDEVEHVELKLFEPPRLFEAFLRGRSALEVPDITARICGICPVAYQMSSVAAVEDALGVDVGPGLRALRRLLYCGEWIESHVLHMVMLHAPDFLGFPDAMAMAREHGARVRDALRVKKAGNAIVALLGGREIHPINVRVGGFYRLPSRAELRGLCAELEACRGLAIALLDWMRGFHFPVLERDYTFLSLRPEGVYPFIEGPAASSDGAVFSAAQWPDHVEEHHVPWSNALHARLHGRGGYQVGPLARYNQNFESLPADLRALAADLGLRPPVRNPFYTLLVRGLETVFALGEAVRIIRAYEPPPAPAVPITLRAGTGHGFSEAPRGVLYHRYTLDDQGLVTGATITPPTSQNQGAIEDDLRAIAPSLRDLDDEAATWRAEQTVRNYDPCISCSVHFLKLKRVVQP